jgi:putative DNA primase/helicase
VLICADDDFKSEGNPGMTAASTAALSVKGEVVAPVFTVSREVGQKGLTDFNDLHLAEGLHTVRSQIEARLDELKWVSDTAPRAGNNIEGGGENHRKAAVSIMALDDAINRFVPLDDGTGKFLFDNWTNKIVQREQMVSLLPAGVRWDDVKRHHHWIDRGAAYLSEVGFDPAGNDKGVKLNTWIGWPLKPMRGKCDALLELIEYLCSGEPDQKTRHDVFRWLLCWMAYPLQNPGAKMNSAVIMHGPQGTGKSTVFQVLGKIYGDYSTVLNQRALEDKFNADWSDSKLFILAEEVVTRAEMWHIKNELKELVTGEWIRVNPKNVAAYRQRNHVNICYLSNEDQPLPLENDDRRHCVIWTPPELSAEYYDELYIELENGGVEAFYHYLLNLELGDFHPKKRPPMTEAKNNLIHRSLPSEDRFVQDWISGDISFDEANGSLPFCACGSGDLYAAYMRWCRQQGEMRPRPQNQFNSRLTRREGWASGYRDRYSTLHCTGEKKRQRMIEPSDKDMVEAMKRGAPDYRKKIDENIAQWATRCYLDMHIVLGGDQ